MAQNEIELEAFSQAVKEICNGYASKDVQEAIEKSLNEAAKVAKKEVQAKAPKRTGKYSKSWKTTKSKSRLSQNVIIHSKDQYQLTHLLEYGHVTRNGGRSRAFSHVEPANETAQNEFLRLLRRELEGG